jgi:chromosomal replication initiation ATPase DnaA
MNYWVIPALAGKVERGISHVEIIVSKIFEVNPSELHSMGRRRPCVEARQMVCYIMHRHYKFTTPRVGRYYDQHHTTVLNSLQRMSGLIETENDMREKYETALEQLNIKLEKYHNGSKAS